MITWIIKTVRYTLIKLLNFFSKKMLSKNHQFLLKVLAERWICNFTTIIKLSYFCDLANVWAVSKSISSYKYIRYYYWPYSKSIQKSIDELASKDYINIVKIPTQSWEEQTLYEITESALSNSLLFSELSDTEKANIHNVVNDLKVFNANQLGAISYKTKPMIEKNATIWWKESREEELNLFAK